MTPSDPPLRAPTAPVPAGRVGGDALRDAPIPAPWTVAAGLEAFLDENGYDLADYDAPRTPAKVLGVRFSVPNPPRHRWAIMRHDLHHVATGFGTDLAGEGELAAWELRRGIRPLGAYVGTIVVSAFLVGLLVAPRRTARAWRAGRGDSSLFHLGERSDDELRAMTIGALRTLLSMGEMGIATGRRGVNGLAPRSSDGDR